MAISPIPRGTTRALSVAIRFNNAVPDISGDIVTLTIKDNKADADPGVLQETADVLASGSSGIAIFSLTPTLTDLPPGQYWYDIVWNVAGGAEYILEENTLLITTRVSDL